ncbi:hypothetical protein ABQZ69_19125 [Xanthomonas sp. WHRI 8391]|uniref:hypothetical protein n=1 Tax=Xanthomonas TaxID=338 RepID=UPI0012601550|nr:hypothetical protein [Xanthomonas hortorum]MBG3850387.1 hypothetical protein [Xanthomonas hortorum pv. carotae]UTS72253.1 hypothetical protein NMB96_17425 [Xanthomonas hortorum]
MALDDFTKVQGTDSGPNPSIGLTACFKDGDKWQRAIPLLLSWDDLRLELSKKNGARIKLPGGSQNG